MWGGRWHGYGRCRLEWGGQREAGKLASRTAVKSAVIFSNILYALRLIIIVYANDCIISKIRISILL